MTFKPGQSGNPGGRGREKPWADALRAAVNQPGPDRRRRLLAIADQCVAAALEGKMDAIKEIGDRLDGKPAQEATITHRHDVTELTDKDIEHRIAELRGIGAPDGDTAPTLS